MKRWQGLESSQTQTCKFAAEEQKSKAGSEVVLALRGRSLGRRSVSVRRKRSKIKAVKVLKGSQHRLVFFGTTEEKQTTTTTAAALRCVDLFITGLFYSYVSQSVSSDELNQYDKKQPRTMKEFQWSGVTGEFASTCHFLLVSRLQLSPSEVTRTRTAPSGAGSTLPGSSATHWCVNERPL